MRRIRKAFGGKSDKAAGKAPAVNEAGDSTDEDVEESAFGLEVLAEGVDPIVEYDSMNRPLDLPKTTNCCIVIEVLLRFMA